jgi:hypothetical protein
MQGNSNKDSVGKAWSFNSAAPTQVSNPVNLNPETSRTADNGKELLRSLSAEEDSKKQSDKEVGSLQRAFEVE